MPCPPGSVRSGDSNPSDRAWPYLSGLIEPIHSLSAGIKARLGRSYSPHLHISQTHASQHARPAAAKVDHGRGYPWAMAFRARALSGKAAISQATPCAKALRFWAMRCAARARPRGDLAQARQLLAEGASLNSRNARAMTPLDVAMVEGNRRAFESLLDLGTDPTWLGDARDTSMHLAAILHDSRWLAALLKRGFPTEVKNRLGETPLFRALGPETQANVQLLLDAGANVHARSKDGRTLLHQAAMISSFDDIPRLLNLGVDPRAVNEAGNTFQRYFFMGPRNPETEKKVRAWLSAHGIAVEDQM